MVGSPVEIMRRIFREKKPADEWRALAESLLHRTLLRELGDAMSETRDFAAGGVLVNGAALRCTHDRRLRILDRDQSRGAVAGGDRFFDLADRIAKHGAARFVDLGLARDLAGSFTGGTGIGHVSLIGDWSLPADRPAKATGLCKNLRG